MYLRVAWSLHSIVSSETVSRDSVTSLLHARNVLFEQLEYFLNEPADGVVGRLGNQLACRVSSPSYVFFDFVGIWILNDVLNSLSQVCLDLSLTKFLCFRYAPYLQNHGFSSGRPIFLQQTWRI